MQPYSESPPTCTAFTDPTAPGVTNVPRLRGFHLKIGRHLPLVYPYIGRNANFVLVSGTHAAVLSPTARRMASRSDVLVEVVQGAPFFFWQETISTEWHQKAGGDGRIDLLEEFEEDQADRIALTDDRRLAKSQCNPCWPRIFQTRSSKAT